MTKTEKLLCELIALPSVNPAFLAGSPALTGETRVSAFLAKAASRAGLDVEYRPALPGRKNFFARLSPRGKVRRRILLAPHLDTVNGSDAQFTPRLSGGRIFGRGACDTKGSAAAMFSALCHVAERGRRPGETEIVFVGLIDEENRQSGSRALAESGFKADLAIVGEPTCLQVVTAHKGNLWIKIEARGKSAHGARPELGENAVHSMAKIVDLLLTDYAKQLRKRTHPLLGHPTVSVGAIGGGTQANIVPDYSWTVIDRRTLPDETPASVRREITSLLSRNKLKARLLDDKLAPCLPLETDAKLPLVQTLLSTARQKRPVGVHYFCDASVLANGGIPSVVFGPGDIAQAHTSNEWIAAASLEGAREMLIQFLTALP